MQWQNSYKKNQITYQNRVMAALIVVLVIVTLVFRFLNFGFEPEIKPAPVQDITIDNVMITEFASAQPVAPQRPIINPEMPADEVIDDEIILDIDGLLFESKIELPGSGAGEIVRNPDRPPRVRRIVEAVTPPEFRVDEYRYIVFVTMTVNEDGRVDEAFISEVLREFADGRSEKIETAPASIVSESLRAAYGWVFSPAEVNDSPVRSNSTHRFVFGG